MKGTNREIPCDWRIVRVNWTRYHDASFLREKGIKTLGVYYLIDVALHVHICSFTPNYEAWPMCAYVEFETDEAADKDEGESELELLNSEELCSYFDTNVTRDTSKVRPLSDYMTPDPQEADESDEDYRRRVADDAREYFAGNPCGF